MWDGIIWRRASEVYGKGLYNVFKTIEPSDVTQGLLGDCYLLAAISALAEKPRRIREIFLSPSVTASGAYAVRFYINGEPTDVVIDDHFPCFEDPEKDCWAFSRGTSEVEIWVLLLEKAYAKVYGSFERIEGGKPYQAFNTLTGFPSDIIFHQTLEGLDL